MHLKSKLTLDNVKELLQTLVKQMKAIRKKLSSDFLESGDKRYICNVIEKLLTDTLEQ